MAPRSFSIECKELPDITVISVAELEQLVPILKAKYGTRCRLIFDAGYNNICVNVVPSKTGPWDTDPKIQESL